MWITQLDYLYGHNLKVFHEIIEEEEIEETQLILEDEYA